MQLIVLFLSLLLAYFVRCDAKSLESNGLDDSGKEKNISGPLYWRSVIDDICQLPSIPRPTTDPRKYIECVYQSGNAGNRTDLGIWVLKECPDGYQFVAPARECQTVDSIKTQQQLCDADGSNYEFCPEPKAGRKFVVKKTEKLPEHCVCPKGKENCECPKIEIIELVPYIEASDDSKTSKVRQARRAHCQGQGCYGDVAFPSDVNCGCATSSPCICPTYSSVVTQVPVTSRQQIPAGCQVLSNGQIYCPHTQTPRVPATTQRPSIITPQPCPLVAGQGFQNAQYQGICSWMIDPLVADPQNPSYFLQCQPAPNSLYCGRWQRMPCEPGLIFNPQLQVCVWDPNAQPGIVPAATQTPVYTSITHVPYASTLYPMTAVPVVPDATSGYIPSTQCGCGSGVQIGACGVNNQCPGQSICNSLGPCSQCCYYTE